MFSLLQGFYTELTHLPERKLLLLGLESCGKSSILEWLKAHFANPNPEKQSTQPPQNLHKMNPTVGLNVAKIPLSTEKLLIWDLGGAKPLRAIWTPYLEEADALIWVVDSVDQAKFAESCQVLKKLLGRPNLENTPLLVYANKQDIGEAVDPVRVSLELALLEDAEKRSHCIQPCSAESGEGIREGIEWLLESLHGGGKLEMRIP